MTEIPQAPFTESTMPALWSAAYTRGFRLARGLTVDALARRSGVDRATVAKAEAGDLAVRPSTVARLAAALDVPLWRLWVLPPALQAQMERDPVAAFPQSDPEPEGELEIDAGGEPVESEAKAKPEAEAKAEAGSFGQPGDGILSELGGPTTDPALSPAQIAAVIERRLNAGLDLRAGPGTSREVLAQWCEWWVDRLTGVSDLRRRQLRRDLLAICEPANDNEEE